MALLSLILGIFSVVMAIIDFTPLVTQLFTKNFGLLLFLTFIPAVSAIAALVLAGITNRKDADGRASCAKLLSVVTIVLSLLLFDNVIYTDHSVVPQVDYSSYSDDSAWDEAEYDDYSDADDYLDDESEAEDSADEESVE